MRESIERNFEEMPLLGVNLLSFAGTHPEGCGIEAPYVVYQASSKGIAAALLFRRGMIECVRRKPIVGDSPDRATPLLQK